MQGLRTTRLAEGNAAPLGADPEERTGTPGKQQARRLAGTEQVNAGEEAVGVLPLTQPRRAGGWMAPAA